MQKTELSEAMHGRTDLFQLIGHICLLLLVNNAVIVTFSKVNTSIVSRTHLSLGDLFINFFFFLLSALY